MKRSVNTLMKNEALLKVWQRCLKGGPFLFMVASLVLFALEIGILSARELPQEPLSKVVSLSPVEELRRQRDPAWVESKDFQGIFDGLEAQSVDLYAYRDQEFHSIPFQIDPIDSDGLVIPGYVNQAKGDVVYDFKKTLEFNIE